MVNLAYIFLFLIALLINCQPQQAPEVRTKLNYLDSPLVDIIWCTPMQTSQNILLVLTESGSIYRSTDEGFNWDKMTDVFQKKGYIEIEKGEKVGNVQKIIRSPVDSGLVLFMGSHGINWYTPDCAQSIHAMNQGRKVTDFMFHPTERNWLLASAWTLCEDFEDKPCQLFKELFVSFDLGENWKVLEDYVIEFSWGQFDETFTNVPKERIILAHEPLGKGHQKLAGWSEKVDVSYSDDFFATSKTLLKNGNKFLMTNNYLFLAQVINQKKSTVLLQISESNLKEYQLYKSVVPANMKQSSYTILDASENQVFLHINHNAQNSKYGFIYISDSTGSRYSLSLKYHVRTPDGQCDFEKLASLEGIYIANVFDSQKVEMIEKQSQTSSASTTTSKKKKKILNIDDFKKTVITFDKGGIWEPLSPPQKDSEGVNIYCPKKDVPCSLHLHSIGNDKFGPFYSSDNAVGIMLGTGNVGYHLANKASEVNTYMSRDGGISWFEIKKGSHIYEIGNHGGILVMAKDQKATKEIIYSWDEGLSWTTQTISSVPIEVENIIIEPSNAATNFIVYGEYGNQTNVKGAVVAIDFSPLHERACQGEDTPGADDSDYEYWIPTSGAKNQKCLMGRKVAYVRRKREVQIIIYQSIGKSIGQSISKCWNPDKYEIKSKAENCQCTEEDWECDLGFARDGDGPCLPINGQQVDYTPPDVCHKYYYVTQGYRKVAGDSCEFGVDHSALRLPCPGFQGFFTIKSFIIILLMALIIGLVYNSRQSLIEFFSGYLENLQKKANLPSLSSQKYDLLNENLATGLHPSDDLGISLEDNDDQAQEIDQNEDEGQSNEKKIAQRGALESASQDIRRLQGPNQEYKSSQPLLN